MRDVYPPRLAEYTTLGLGGEAERLIEVDTADDVVTAVRSVTGPLLVLAGGSNVVVADEGFAGTVVLLRTSGIDVTPAEDGVSARVAAGHGWDDFVARAVGEGWSGVECLSGVPGSAGATPIQNVGAYGQEVSETITEVTVYDRVLDRVETYSPERCRFAYRGSVFKHDDRYVVLDVTFRLRLSEQSGPLRYAETARALGVEAGETAPLALVRETVLGLRRGKGMVLDPADPDSRSVGSFFVNPVLSAAEFETLVARAGTEPPCWPDGDRVKTSAAWLIQHAGFEKGYGRDGVAISGKHTLALTNRGDGTTTALLDLAAEIRDGVRKAFDVVLRPEPVLVGVEGWS
ncbi:UDP-N-acetylmuramate dehydrogenase [Phytomonospora endophytica]|uniref:UDP-N-acetylenolpyruvoylglucosamine reductase n=1 Tax=Phytomonospora endophytica TaxID=714109 RepID=A0A841FRA1_9ACTN|nr:UDP-N-acetylmuramate dehydrogenase [Phytomonospora endophytica]MBB6036308.1 UDP-N-acetylmuramate dehydrogenase [Phytomonospora endophytica]GIG67215.1 UDP-N-acetylenolpyruvoylglucosamine reductase [Phytomonospora endophytica]